MCSDTPSLDRGGGGGPEVCGTNVVWEEAPFFIDDIMYNEEIV